MISLTKQDALGPLDYNCSLALAYAYFGVKKHEKKLETDGRILYGKSLHAVKTILESDDKQEIGRTTSAVLILGLIAVNRQNRHLLNMNCITDTALPDCTG